MARTHELTCPACHAAPGTPHSLACDDPIEFDRQEHERLDREHYARLAATRLANARGEIDAAMVEAQRTAVALVEGGMSEVQAAAFVGIDRMTLRKALGKR